MALKRKMVDNYEFEEPTSTRRTLILPAIKGMFMNKIRSFSHLFFIILKALIKGFSFLKVDTEGRDWRFKRRKKTLV